MASVQGEGNEGVVLDVDDYAPVTYPIAPQIPKSGFTQGLPVLAWIVGAVDALSEERDDTPRDLLRLEPRETVGAGEGNRTPVFSLGIEDAQN